MSTAEEKLDFLIKSVAAIREDQAATNDKMADNKRNLDDRFRKLKKNVVAAQEDATERAIKRARRERPLEFKNRAHQEQFSFNSEVADHVGAAARKIQKLNPSREKEQF